jgi:photosystem II stability/assembly factor-like uncharacterized protein
MYLKQLLFRCFKSPGYTYSPCKLLLILLLPFLTSYASAQGTSEIPDTADFPYWMQMMQDPNANFYATQSAFNKYWENRDTKEKGTGYKVFKRWEYITQSHISPDGNRQSPGYVSKALKDYFENDPPDRSVSGTWTLSGPINYPTNATGQPTGMGRINAIAFHPTDPDIIFIGTPSGGIWKTTDGGDNWTSITSNLPTPGISSIFVHPGDPNIIYVGTGDRDSDDAPGLGVYKTTNGGASWTAANSSMPNATVGALLVHPSNPDTMIAATNTGLYRSTNGGNTWSLRLTGNVWKDLKYMPGNPVVVYAAYGGSFYRSTNSGLNWSNISIPQTGSRLVIGVSPDAPGTVYLVQSASNSTFKALMRSTDNGATFSTMSTTPNIFDYKCDGSGTSGQGFYDLCIHVDPNDADIVYCGSINVWKSTDGGVNWTPKSHWVGIEYDPLLCSPAVHADQHCLERSPLTGTIYLGNDGGFYFTSDGGDTWTEKSGGLSISQVYRIGQSNLDANLTLSGYQDNGTSLRDGSTFTTVGGGDGMECLFDYSNNTYRYRSGPSGALSRSTGSYYYTIGGKDKNGITESGDWVTPYMLHRTNPNTMFAGYKNVWRTTNVKTALNTDVTWSAISSGETSNCIAIEQPAGDLDILYVVRSGSLKRTDNANASAASVTWVSCALPGGYTPTDLETHPTDPDILYANYGVYKSTDKGATWTNISGTLPAVFTNCLVYDQNSNEGLYVGNQTGVWYKDITLADWVPFGTGLPIIDVRELEIYVAPDPADSRLMAATYGRGLWSSDLYITTIPPDIGYVSALANPICEGTTTTLSANDVTGTNAMVTWWTGPGGTGMNLGTGTELPDAGPGTYYARVTGDGSPAAEDFIIIDAISLPAIDSVTAGAYSLCGSNTTTLTAHGIAGDGATVNWWTGAGGTGTNLGTGTTLSDVMAGTYFAYVTGTCTPASETSVTIEALTVVTWYLDADNDGFGDINDPGTGFCTDPGMGYAHSNTDCDDASAAINPAATEICNSNVDDDCDNLADNADESVTGQSIYYADNDADGYGAGAGIQSCTQPANTSTNNTDCNDVENSVNPGATEICNTIDDDCDISIDEGVTNTYYADNDADGFGAGTAIEACSQAENTSTNDDDCDDNDNSVNPGATEVCNTIDDDCDTNIDEGVTNTYYADNDADGYGAGTAIEACSQPANSSTNNTDCDDISAAINPGATEVCNGTDDDCDLSIDEGAPTVTYYQDADGDGKGNPLVTVDACAQPMGYVTNNTDCDDNTAVPCPRPTATATTDITDVSAIFSWTGTNCASRYRLEYRQKTTPALPWIVVYVTETSYELTGLSEGTNYQWRVGTVCTPGGTSVPAGFTLQLQFKTKYRVFPDADFDGYGSAVSSSVLVNTFPATGYSTDNTDCNDAVAATHPNATELCNGVDDDCDGTVDDGIANPLVWYQDADDDGLGNELVSLGACTQPAGYVSNSNDCDDNSNVLVCAPPTNGLVSDLNATTATLSWSVVPCALRYTMQYRRILPTGAWSTKVNIDNTTTTLTGLLPNTTYQLRVRSLCPSPNPTTSDWLTITFTTTALPMGLVETTEMTDLHTADPTTIQVAVYPNPGDGRFNLHITSETDGEADITVMDGFGKLIQTVRWSVFEGITINELDLTHLPGGVYHINIRQGDMIQTKKVVIVR